jgi:tRNA-Thr(GGU) m(6)t(6)A37 methyltransferase TsaA
MDITFRAIATVHSPFSDPVGMPIQPVGAAGVKGTVEVEMEFAEGLQDIEGFSHLVLIYYLHRIQQSKLTVVPFLDTVPHGIFATRSPARPNPIGLSIVKLTGRQDHILHIENVDILDGTPVLDIKPYVPEFDQQQATQVGWFEQARGKVGDRRADQRFV